MVLINITYKHIHISIWYTHQTFTSFPYATNNLSFLSSQDLHEKFKVGVSLNLIGSRIVDILELLLKTAEHPKGKKASYLET